MPLRNDTSYAVFNFMRLMSVMLQDKAMQLISPSLRASCVYWEPSHEGNEENTLACPPSTPVAGNNSRLRPCRDFEKASMQHGSQ